MFTHQDLCHVALHWKGFRGGVHEPVDQFYQSSFQRGDLKSQEAESPVPSAVLHRMRRRGVVPAEGSGGAVGGAVGTRGRCGSGSLPRSRCKTDLGPCKPDLRASL